MPRTVWHSGTGNRCTVNTGLLRNNSIVGSSMSPVSCSMMISPRSWLEEAVQQQQALSCASSASMRCRRGRAVKVCAKAYRHRSPCLAARLHARYPPVQKESLLFSRVHKDIANAFTEALTELWPAYKMPWLATILCSGLHLPRLLPATYTGRCMTLPTKSVRSSVQVSMDSLSSCPARRTPTVYS